ncbi:MAG: hypothetical protein P8I62_06490 [Pseudomonadales bacterium]|nr:hypothetical protein [Pseudomonadales bacterium]
MLAKAIDPKDQRDNQQRKQNAVALNTLHNVAMQWLQIKRAKISEDHANDTWRSLELHLLPALGKVPIHKLTAVKTIAVIKPLVKKGSLETVK